MFSSRSCAFITGLLWVAAVVMVFLLALYFSPLQAVEVRYRYRPPARASPHPAVVAPTHAILPANAVLGEHLSWPWSNSTPGALSGWPADPVLNLMLTYPIRAFQNIGTNSRTPSPIVTPTL